MCGCQCPQQHAWLIVASSAIAHRIEPVQKINWSVCMYYLTPTSVRPWKDESSHLQGCKRSSALVQSTWQAMWNEDVDSVYDKQSDFVHSQVIPTLHHHNCKTRNNSREQSLYEPHKGWDCGGTEFEKAEKTASYAPSASILRQRLRDLCQVSLVLPTHSYPNDEWICKIQD